MESNPHLTKKEYSQPRSPVASTPDTAQREIKMLKEQQQNKPDTEIL